MEIILIIYLALGYWATGKTIYRNKILIGTGYSIFCKKLVVGFMLGFILIPIALIGLLFRKNVRRDS